MARRSSTAKRAAKETAADTLAALTADVAGRLAKHLPEGADAGEVAGEALRGPLVAALVNEAVAGVANADCGQHLDHAYEIIAELNEALEAAKKMIARQARGLDAERRTKIDGSEPALQLEAIAAMLYDRVPHEMHGREHLPIGTIVMEVLDRRLPCRDPRGLMAENGWPGRRKAPKVKEG